jgi:hypothetical protein
VSRERIAGGQAEHVTATANHHLGPERQSTRDFCTKLHPTDRPANHESACRTNVHDIEAL